MRPKKNSDLAIRKQLSREDDDYPLVEHHCDKISILIMVPGRASSCCHDHLSCYIMIHLDKISQQISEGGMKLKEKEEGLVISP